MNTPDGGVTDEPMPLEWMQAYADAYPDRVPAYVAENGAPNLRKVQDDAQPGVSPMVHTAPSQSADLIAEAECWATGPSLMDRKYYRPGQRCLGRPPRPWR